MQGLLNSPKGRPTGRGSTMPELTLEDGEKLYIGDDIVVTVGVVEGKVRLIVDAPKGLDVVRAELD